MATRANTLNQRPDFQRTKIIQIMKIMKKLMQNELWRFMRRRPLMLFGICIVTLSFFLAVFGEIIAPFPTQAPAGPSLVPPNTQFLFGTDVSGLDIFSRVIAAPRIDLTIALVSTTIAFLGGVFLGLISGFFSGHRGISNWISIGIMRTADVFQAFPIFVFALALVGFTGPSTKNVIIALAFLNVPFFLRIMRGAVLEIRERTYIDAARCSGNSNLRIAFVHVMPNAIGPSLVHYSTTIGFSILLTAGLSFVGAGVAPPTPEWGLMIQLGAQSMMTGQWWAAVFPGAALGITILGYALLGDNLRIFMDPVNRR
jgi:peptide/nickel transport system permease protein